MGVAYDREEASPGLICVAAPILAANGTASAALSVSMPVGAAMTPAAAAPAVQLAARSLSRELGGGILATT